MAYKVDNAVIMAAGLSSRFAPISYEKPKALMTVKSEVLIERQIKQLQAAGITEIVVVVGYMKEKFEYLTKKFGVKLVENYEYATRNNNSTIYAVKNHLKNTYICSADNYFEENPFESEVDDAYYAAVFVDGDTEEWCITYDENNTITDVTIGGCKKWVMLGHAFWTKEFSDRFCEILESEYSKVETINKFWENLYIDHIDELKLKIKKYPDNYIYEFDSLDELRVFDTSYMNDTQSPIIKDVAKELNCEESSLINFYPEKNSEGEVIGCTFELNNNHYKYNYKERKIYNA